MCAAALAIAPAAGCTLNEYGAAAVYSSTVRSDVKVIVPANAPSISQQFRVSSDTVAEGGPSAHHEGIDIIARAGTAVIAAAPGRIVSSYAEPMYGNRVVIDHGVDGTGSRTLTVYKHLQKRLVGEGGSVARGQQVGTMGRTGLLAGGISHLHFEVHREIKPQGPLPVDPNLHWADGIGRVSCFDPSVPVEAAVFRATYPVPCGRQ